MTGTIVSPAAESGDTDAFQASSAHVQVGEHLENSLVGNGPKAGAVAVAGTRV